MAAARPPLRRDAERNRVLILESARALFAERGFAVSLDEIARHAGVGVGTVYRRFPSREQLIDALFDERLAEIVALAQDGLACEDPWLGFARFLERALEPQAADKGLKELILSTREGRDRVTQFRARMIPLANELVRRAQAAGTLREDFSPRDIPLLQMMLGAIADAAEPIRPGLWRRYLALTLDGMRADRPHRSLPVAAVDVDELDCVMRSWRPSRRGPHDA